MKSTAQIKALRKRLKNNSLTDVDIEYIDGLLASFDVKALGKTKDGRRIIARLPGGLDLVK